MRGSPANGRIELRIGIHLGDVIVEGDDILGDGVNIAARLEGTRRARRHLRLGRRFSPGARQGRGLSLPISASQV